MVSLVLFLMSAVCLWMAYLLSHRNPGAW